MPIPDEYFETLGDTIVRENRELIDFFINYDKDKKKSSDDDE